MEVVYSADAPTKKRKRWCDGTLVFSGGSVRVVDADGAVVATAPRAALPAGAEGDHVKLGKVTIQLPAPAPTAASAAAGPARRAAAPTTPTNGLSGAVAAAPSAPTLDATVPSAPQPAPQNPASATTAAAGPARAGPRKSLTSKTAFKSPFTRTAGPESTHVEPPGPSATNARGDVGKAPEKKVPAASKVPSPAARPGAPSARPRPASGAAPTAEDSSLQRLPAETAPDFDDAQWVMRVDQRAGEAPRRTVRIPASFATVQAYSQSLLAATREELQLRTADLFARFAEAVRAAPAHPRNKSFADAKWLRSHGFPGFYAGVCLIFKKDRPQDDD
ncbi:hypothetical protein M885DRAFT_336369 [Pelagophyceae sp. CCMP2097]|nr:hypothetical protein M885DRAFT_336369 [Pelagophyceae sp. CCMP2097]